MVETAKGIDRILLFRVLDSKDAASKLAFQTEHEVSKTRDSDSVATKDGYVQSLGDLETEISVTSILAQGDEFATEIEEAFDDGKVIEIWDIDRNGEASADKYPATYYQAYMTDFSQTPNAEDDIEMEMEFSVNGKGVKGEATLTEEQETVVQYAFKDTTAEV
ncbi:MAG: phage major tail protein, TP901-1 family [Alkalibacterium sp.]|nr:phage major tail protein, TP901-1 family [Alkalibacterium sp.]MDN6397673.1 phage major tail protein, TP901-1 family [Alkalibacterium sp.]MDN6626014.1 phage major tail protein, TP901-1 family [Pisciglobus halotolerans]MDN6671170.1 phage major tail protein, TP901-1 family [Staphylococcus equorum]MDN6699168.1 phage major tail protein, TP901-1 family [Staphylococcus equorum]